MRSYTQEMSIEGIEMKNMEVYLEDISKIIQEKYKVICDGEVLQNTEENATRYLAVPGISVVDGKSKFRL